MRRILWICFQVWPFPAWGQDTSTMETQRKKPAWQVGPSDARIGDKATINVPAGHVFLGEKNTRRFLESMGNPAQGGHDLLTPDTLEGFSVISVNPSGYMKDDEEIEAASTQRRIGLRNHGLQCMES